MIPSTAIKLIGIVVVIITTISVTSAQQYVCRETLNPTAAPVCNTTALQSTLPAKTCAWNDYQNDFAFYCVDYIYNIWLDICPKQNHDVQGFCGGQGIANLTCLLTPCTTDADCPQPTPSANVPSYNNPPPTLPCYECCQPCFEDTDCDIKVNQGVYAQRGDTNCISCASSAPTPVASPVSAPVSQERARVRFANAQMGATTYLGLAVAPNGAVPGLAATSSDDFALPASDYLTFPLPALPLNQVVSFYLQDLISGNSLTFPRNATLAANQSYTFFSVGPSNTSTQNTTIPYSLFAVAELPKNPSLYAGQALVKVVNAVASSYGTQISITISEGITIMYTQVSFGSSTFFLPFKQRVDINAYLDGETLLIRNLTLQPDATTFVYLRGNLEAGYRWSTTVVPFSAVTPPIEPPVASPVINTPVSPSVCVNGYVESTGYCNCYSGFTNNPLLPQYECSASPNYYCLPLSEAMPMDNYIVPTISNLRTQRNVLRMSITSSFVAGRRTLIEFPNSECNLINSPNFYNKTNNGCSDEYLLEIPFADCGFTMTSETEYDIYRGEMHVKHIDIVQIDGKTIERVIETPFTIAIRLPKYLAVQTSVEIIATPVATALKAVFIGQTVDVATQTGQLLFLTSVPAPLIVLSGRISHAPNGVNATLRLIDQNCSDTSTAGFCQQQIAIDLDIIDCEISGVYTMEVRVRCSSQQNCPIGFNEYFNVTLASYITAQPTCGEAFVDIGLFGFLQAFNDESFTSQALSFNAGKPAFFLINAYAGGQVDIASVTLDGVFYYGPNVPGNFLLTNDTVSELGSQNNFNWGQHSNSQAWFSLAVTVSKPDSNENTLFKLNNDESGVYNFMALVSVEWIENGANVKKRVVLESKSFNQGSQFSAQVQIANTKKDDAMSMSSIVAISSSILFASVFVSLF